MLDIEPGNPGIIAIWIALPLNQILKLSPKEARVEDAFYLIFFFFIDKVRRWCTE